MFVDWANSAGDETRNASGSSAGMRMVDGVLALCLVSNVILTAGCATDAAGKKPLEPKESISHKDTQRTGEEGHGNMLEAHADASMEEAWGVKVVGIRPTAAGYMLDFRYRVTDAEKAKDLLDRRFKPQLIVEKSGATLAVPVTAKLGALRQYTKNIRADRNYFIFFGNPGRYVKSGDKVSIVIGQFKAENLTVQ